ncbi:MAG: nucleotide sugar dehydrogenase, partial [Planctomycetota bacterium]
VGLGYVGLPLVREFVAAGFRVLGYDIDAAKTDMLNRGDSYLMSIPAEMTSGWRATGRFEATTDPARLAEPDAILICVPTPLTRTREPEMRYVRETAETIGKHLRAGQLVVLESTTWPGTTAELVQPRLEALSKLKTGTDYLLAFSPEREDPGSRTHTTKTIPKVVGADDATSLEAACALYEQIIPKVVAVSGSRPAEATKLLENIFRAVNIAMVNELKMIFDRMGIDVWEVIEAAKSKPFGYMPFYPGPGLGGHCIPIDPFYLTWKAREFDFATRFIELAGEINTQMPRYVVTRVMDALNDRGRALKGAKVLMLGAAYKKDVDDARESPSLELFELLEARGAEVSYYDPYVPRLSHFRNYPGLEKQSLPELSEAVLAGADAVLIVTDHTSIDYARVLRHASLVVDTRNACAGLSGTATVVKA